MRNKKIRKGLYTYSVASSLCLQIVLGVPIAVINNHSIGSSQIQTESSCLGAQQKHEALLKKKKK